MADNKKAWDDVFKTEGRVFEDAHPDVLQIARDLQPATDKRILDLGSGSGRHIVTLASAGYDVYGFDYAEQGIHMTRQWLEQENLTATLQIGDMTAGLPYEDNFFDAVISIQVIHHARLSVIESLIDEIARVLKPGGTTLITVALHKNQANEYEEIEPNTFVPLDGWEKGLPHYFFDEAQLRQSFAKFDIETTYVDTAEHLALRGTCKT